MSCTVPTRIARASPIHKQLDDHGEDETPSSAQPRRDQVEADMSTPAVGHRDAQENDPDLAVALELLAPAQRVVEEEPVRHLSRPDEDDRQENQEDEKLDRAIEAVKSPAHGPDRPPAPQPGAASRMLPRRSVAPMSFASLS